MISKLSRMKWTHSSRSNKLRLINTRLRTRNLVKICRMLISTCRNRWRFTRKTMCKGRSFFKRFKLWKTNTRKSPSFHSSWMSKLTLYSRTWSIKSDRKAAKLEQWLHQAITSSRSASRLSRSRGAWSVQIRSILKHWPQIKSSAIKLTNSAGSVLFSTLFSPS